MKAIIVGGGKLGSRLSSALSIENYDVTVVDKSEKAIADINSSLDVLTAHANGLDFDVLKELEISSYDLLIATTTSDEANVLICTVAKKLGCNKCIARVRNPEYHKQVGFIIDELGIDHIINPDYATALNIEKYLLKKYLLMTDEFAGGKVKLAEFNIQTDENFVGREIKDLEDFENLLITAVSRNGETIIPYGSTVLEENDVVLICGPRKEVDLFDEKHSGIRKSRTVQRVMILGGGKLGLYLGLLLKEDKIDTTIIEIDKERCIKLKERLPNATIINGDGTNLTLLEEEMMDTNDAFVAATGIDETNLLMALSAKQMGIYKSVAKISRPNYNQILEKLSLDGAFNTSFITASEILRILRGSGSLSVNLMLDGDAEFTEILVKEGAKIINKKVMDLNLPQGILLISVLRDEKAFIPNGNTVLVPGDRVVVFCTHENIQTLKSIFYNKKKKKSDFINELFSGI